MKLAIVERESEALEQYLEDWPDISSSALLRVEALRAIRLQGPERLAAAYQRLRRVDLIALDGSILEDAAMLEPPLLRSLDAIHLATARQLGPDLGVLITYDRRLTEAASVLRIPLASPA